VHDVVSSGAKRRWGRCTQVGHGLLGAGLLLIVWLVVGHAGFALSTKTVQNSLEDLFSPNARTASSLADRKEIPETFLRTPLERRLFADAADGRLDEHDLLEAALVASGVQEADSLRRYRQRYAALVEELRQSGNLATTPRQQAQAVLEFMHRRILVAGYRANSTDLRAALDDGWFNCVSATILFDCLADDLGLEVRGLETPGHVRSRVCLPGDPFDVETTCAGWFRLADKPARRTASIQQTLGRLLDSDRPQAREVTVVQMAAMVYYNRGIDLMAQKRFDEAAAANAKALWLDPASTAAWGNLIATINNWAVVLCASDRYAEAVDLLRCGLVLAPKHEALASNWGYVHRQWIAHLYKTGHFEQASEVSTQAVAVLPGRSASEDEPPEDDRHWAPTLRAGERMKSTH
jgi:tetratricopeptide (TPR) repeat protein